MVEVKQLEYKRGNFIVFRNKYLNIPENLIPKVGDVVQQADNSFDEEFKILKIEEDTAVCEDISTGIQRTFYTDSIIYSKKQIQRDKKERIRKKKIQAQLKKEEKLRRKALRELKKNGTKLK